MKINSAVIKKIRFLETQYLNHETKEIQYEKIKSTCII